MRVQGVPSQSEAAGDLADQQMVPDDHFGPFADAYQRVQRVRAKKVSLWLQKRNCLSVLVTASFVLSPLERLMPGPQLIESLAHRLQVDERERERVTTLLRQCLRFQLLQEMKRREWMDGSQPCDKLPAVQMTSPQKFRTWNFHFPSSVQPYSIHK